MTPTFMFGKSRQAAIGTPGGSRIITMVLLGILDFMDGNDPESWVSLPRFHHQFLPDEISAEEGAFSTAEINSLEDMGHTVTVRNRTWGNMHGILWDRMTGTVSAGSDPRWPSGRAIVQ
jgi:gamma-glutamyltranspeptidase/glutathione hydrolase